MYEQVNRKLRKIEGQIKANERRYEECEPECRTFEAMEDYVWRGIALNVKLAYEIAKQSRRFDAYEQMVLQDAVEQAEASAGWDSSR